MNHWMTSEIKLLRELYPRASMAEVLAAIPRHPAGSISNMASHLKIRRGHRSQSDWQAIAARHRFTFDLGTPPA